VLGGFFCFKVALEKTGTCDVAMCQKCMFFGIRTGNDGKRVPPKLSWLGTERKEAGPVSKLYVPKKSAHEEGSR